MHSNNLGDWSPNGDDTKGAYGASQEREPPLLDFATSTAAHPQDDRIQQGLNG